MKSNAIFGRRRSRFGLLAFFACLTALPHQAKADSDPATQAGLIPHKSLYEIKMISTRNSSQFQNLSGQMYYEWQPSCEAWVSNHRFNMVYEYTDAPSMRITSDYSTYEPFDGKSMNFTSQRKRDGQIFEEIRGSAEITRPSESQAKYTIPEGLIQPLPQNTLFPMSHTLMVLQKIRAGEKFHRAVIFDGSDQEGPMQVTSFVGKPIEPSDIVQVAAGIDAELMRSKAWKVRLAFFPDTSEEAGADYEMSVVFHENGVISDIVIDYEDFSVSQKLVALEKLGSACTEGKPTPQPLKQPEAKTTEPPIKKP
ncbi:MAG: cell envelope integrity EipB family protein [Alphaproteobacteria bacterium]|jgi:hypothetical protein|nr:cell envelope integrity EipB family protein [Alphaproteobacteria bacterium]QQS58227.1 MAG: cell envelope integrity EipB family protein [Alphaproteobacteria bacterium]